jgi:acetyltransferase-like isoleucine patch superfamily enzyme
MNLAQQDKKYAHRLGEGHISAGSVVTKDMTEYNVVYGGIPATKIKALQAV